MKQCYRSSFHLKTHNSTEEKNQSRLSASLLCQEKGRISVFDIHCSLKFISFLQDMCIIQFYIRMLKGRL